MYREGNEYFEMYYPLCSMHVSSTFVLVYFVKIWSIHRKCDDPNITLGETKNEAAFLLPGKVLTSLELC